MNKKLRDAGQALIVASALIVPAIGRADAVPLDELSAQWWQWLLSNPEKDNPNLDISGDDCMVGQRGSIWFLAGTFGGAASRTCSIPQGTTLFFPVVNSVQVNTPGDCGQDSSVTLDVDTMRMNNAGFINGITIKTVTVDGVAAGSISRVKSVPFVTALPAKNIFVDFCRKVRPKGQRPGIFSPSVDDGYYAKIDNLSLGSHMLQITASNGNGFDLSISYVLNVVQVSLK